MNKLRLDYFLMRGGLLSVGDAFLGVMGQSSLVQNASHAHKLNQACKANSERLITSFSPRKNNGYQPVPDDFPVVVTCEYENVGCFKHIVPKEFDLDWSRCSVYKKWKPDIEELIEQQSEYDKAQENEVKTENNYTQNMKDKDETKVGMFYFDGNGDKCEFIGENKAQSYFVGKFVDVDTNELSICDAHLCGPIVKITPEQQRERDVIEQLSALGFDSFFAGKVYIALKDEGLLKPL